MSEKDWDRGIGKQKKHHARSGYLDLKMKNFHLIVRCGLGLHGIFHLVEFVLNLIEVSKLFLVVVK